jgi:hydroxyacylglutathione hydrolase
VLVLPPIDRLFPANSRWAIVRFWLKYWLWFFVLLPWMLLRQLGLVLHQLAGALWTWNREVSLLHGRLCVRFLNSLRSLAVTSVFGERFTCLQYDDILIDPGPVFARGQLGRRLAGARVSAIVSTHAHEEHTGNALAAAAVTGAPILGTPITLAAVRAPERLSLPRRLFIGQPQSGDSADLRPLSDTLPTTHTTLQVIQSPGHCEGHASLLDPVRGVLFAGDSFLHTIFTAPNREVVAKDWLATLDDYLGRPIRTMVGTHGYIYSIDPDLPAQAFLIQRRDPLAMIRDKRAFLLWAREVVAEGERLGLPYSVIEACLFPWQRRWSWHNWFVDEGGRLFSGGEFSRTYFLRSLSRTPEKVPPRFPPFARLISWLRGR